MTSIRIWKRYESHTRDLDIRPALEATVHDPLWFLARQWQWGEFLAHDGGTPIATRLEVQSSHVLRYLPGRPEDRSAVRWEVVAKDARRAAIGSARGDGTLNLIVRTGTAGVAPSVAGSQLLHLHRTSRGGWISGVLPELPVRPWWPVALRATSVGLFAAAIGRDGRLQITRFDEGKWEAWTHAGRGPGLTGEPVLSGGDEVTSLFALTRDGTLIEIELRGGAQSYATVGRGHRGRLIAASFEGDTHLFSRRGGGIWHGIRAPDGSWDEEMLATDDTPLRAESDPLGLTLLARSAAGRLVARSWTPGIRRRGRAGHIATPAFDDGVWHDPIDLGTTGMNAPQMVPLDDGPLLVRARASGGVEMRTLARDDWWQELPGRRMSSRISALTVGDSLHVLGLAADRSGTLVHGIHRLVRPRDIEGQGAPLEATVEGEGAGGAWRPERLEYSLSLAAPVPSGDGSTLIVAEGYRGGGLDWHDFSIDSDAHLHVDGQAPSPEEAVLLPTPVSFRGMPAARWWAFEDATIDVGAIETAPEDLARLIVMEFALGFGNDWFTVPIRLPAGSLARVNSVQVLDTFGEIRSIPPVSIRRPDTNWRWLELALRRTGTARSSTVEHRERPHLFIAPVLASSLQGEPIEDVLFGRDHMANLAWAIENIVPDDEGRARDRNDRGGFAEEGEASAPNPPAIAPLRYDLAEYPPPNWIPLVPVQLEDGSSITLRLGTLLGKDGERRLPEGKILVPGGFVYEEEVPRSGTRVRSRYQFCRRLNGQRHLWVSRERTSGKGEGGSGLRFDRVIREPGTD